MKGNGTFIVRDKQEGYLCKVNQKYNPNLVTATWSPEEKDAHKFSTWNAAWVAKQKAIELDRNPTIICLG